MPRRNEVTVERLAESERRLRDGLYLQVEDMPRVGVGLHDDRIMLVSRVRLVGGLVSKERWYQRTDGKHQRAAYQNQSGHGIADG